MVDEEYLQSMFFFNSAGTHHDGWFIAIMTKGRMYSTFAQNSTLSGNPISFKDDANKKFVFTFEILLAVRLYIGVFLPKLMDVFALDGLSLFFKDLCVLMLGSPLFGAEQQVRFTGASGIAH